MPKQQAPSSLSLKRLTKIDARMQRLLQEVDTLLFYFHGSKRHKDALKAAQSYIKTAKYEFRSVHDDLLKEANNG